MQSGLIDLSKRLSSCRIFLAMFGEQALRYSGFIVCYLLLVLGSLDEAMNIFSL
jgi:hypothetical protein